MSDALNMYDLIIIGAGPAGLAASIYAGRAKQKVLLIEKNKIGGQITTTHDLANYPGYINISGTSLTETMYKQARNFNVEFVKDEVLDMDLVNKIKTISTKTSSYKALSVILALGASPKKQGFDGEDKFVGRGVCYCAICDGEFFKDLPIYVIGDSELAIEEAHSLLKYGSELILVNKKDRYDCNGAEVEELSSNSKVKILYNTDVVKLDGDNNMESITLINKITKETDTYSYPNGFGVFVFAGKTPNTSWSKGAINTDNGYFITNEKMQTNLQGVFAAGDVCKKTLRQVITAAADGAIAATSAVVNSNLLHKELGLPKFSIKENTDKITDDKPTTINEQDDSKFISDELKNQLVTILSKFDNVITVKGVVNDSILGKELANFIYEMDGISDKVKCIKEVSKNNDTYLEILDTNNNSSGIKFYTVPGGHEFNSFILALYNVAGPGKPIDVETLQKAKSIEDSLDIKVIISLSCTMCPDVVVNACKLASVSPMINTSIYDINHFEELKDKYQIRSVPAIIINDHKVIFGKKSIEELLNI